ncbi:glycosyl transferase [Achromobacter sp. GG226]|uniref:glycosyl transferase n=1 Tax=Verticiella alkaliphila TaxID=2779529 RepID=UPI001C0DB641|nr:glycosyl transferase [Verticiella sp. GG226]MBU4609192.1 glycosyl transferase [Verticiella sp. GG226]
MSDIHVFTSAAFNYIPKVRMLFQSIRKHHPEWKLHLALADELRPHIDLSQEPFDQVWAVADLEIPDWKGWAYCHTIVELATAIKPFVLGRLLDLPDAKKVIYLDPDTVAFSPLDDIIEALDSANIVLTPHQTKPETSLPAVIDNEICSLKHGIYNLGFVAVAATDVGRAFAAWWGERIYHFCRADIPNGLFTDQRWIDLVPAFFTDVAIMRSSRHNVATWNLTTREFSISEDGQYLVDGEPLGFYHFTGFDSGAHRIMAAKNSRDNASVKKLVDWYDHETAALAHDPLAKERWAYGSYSDGTPIGKAERLVYRERVDLQRAYPDPFDATGYLVWWRQQGKVEYPGLFDEATREQAMGKLSSVLTPGYRGGNAEVDWQRMRSLMRQSLTQPRTALALGKRSWEILRNEGVAGIKRRLGG